MDELHLIHHHKNEHLAQYKTFLAAIISDNEITDGERIACFKLRKKLNLSEEEHAQVLKELGWTTAQFSASNKNVNFDAYVKYLEATLADGKVEEAELELLERVRTKFNISDEDHQRALTILHQTQQGWENAINEGKKKIGAEKFGVYHHAKLDYWDPSNKDNQHCYGLIVFPRIRQWVYRNKDTGEKRFVREKYERTANSTELFYDLVFVGIIRTLTHLVAYDVSKWYYFFVLYSAVWQIWITTMYYATRFDADDLIHKVFYYFQMYGVACMALSVTAAFKQGGTMEFACAFIVSTAPTLFMYIYSTCHEKKTKISQWNIITSIVSLIPWIISAILQKYFYYFWSAGLFIALLSPHVSGMFRKFEAPINVEHWVERQGLFIIIVLGEAVISLLNDVPTGVHWQVYLSVALGLLVTFGIKWIYFEGQGQAKKVHALNRNHFVAVLWTLSHWPLTIAITALAAGNIGIQKYLVPKGLYPSTSCDNSTDDLHEDKDPKFPEWLFCVSLGTILLFITLHGFISVERSHYLIHHWIRCIIRLIVGVGIILLPNIHFGIDFSGLVLLGLVAFIVLILSLFEVIGTLSTRKEIEHLQPVHITATDD